jgi:hypothetical protein
MAFPGIDPADWAKLDQLLDEALDLPPAERARWLDALPAEHEPLKPRLRALLANAAPGPAAPVQTLPKLAVPATEADDGVASGRAGESMGPLDVYAREARLDLRSRLGLFLQVARAVAHAHARLVVHRDLKAGNILVTSEGQVRLLDFGIAKLLEQGRAEESELTRVSGRALSPSYASPEQIEGSPLGVASDVYSLGVVLYELLAEARPYRPDRDSAAALEEAVLRADPARPSDVAGNPRLARALRGDPVAARRAPVVHPCGRHGHAGAVAPGGPSRGGGAAGPGGGLGGPRPQVRPDARARRRGPGPARPRPGIPRAGRRSREGDPSRNGAPASRP